MPLPISHRFLILLVLVTLFLHIRGFTGNPMAFSAAAQAVSLSTGRLEVDNFAGLSNDLAYVKGHYYTGIRPSHSLFYLPAAILLRLIPQTVLLDGLFIPNPKLPPPVQPGLFVAITLVTTASFIIFWVWMIFKNVDFATRMAIWTLVFATPALSLASGFYVQSFALLGLIFLVITLVNGRPHFFALSLLFLGLADYTWLPLVGIFSLIWLVDWWRQPSGSLKTWLPFIILAAFLLFDCWFQWRGFYSPFVTPYSYRFSNSAIHTQGFLGLQPANFFPGLAYRLFSAREGVVFFAPELIMLSLVSGVLVLLGSLPTLNKFLFLAVVLWVWFIAASFVDPVSGLPGNRYLIPLLPFVFLPVIQSFGRISGPLRRLITVALIFRTFWTWHFLAVSGNVNLTVREYAGLLFHLPPAYIFAKYLQTDLPYQSVVSVFGWLTTLTVLCLVTLIFFKTTYNPRQ